MNATSLMTAEPRGSQALELTAPAAPASTGQEMLGDALTPNAQVPVSAPTQAIGSIESAGISTLAAAGQTSRDVGSVGIRDASIQADIGPCEGHKQLATDTSSLGDWYSIQMSLGNLARSPVDTYSPSGTSFIWGVS